MTLPPVETLMAHPAIRAMLAFVNTNPNPLELWKFTEALCHEHPDQEWALRFFVVSALCPGQLNELVLDGSLKMYHGEAPIDPWRVVGDKLTFRDLKEGVADIFDIVRAYAAMDREASRRPHPDQQETQDPPVLRMVRQLYESGQLPRRKNGTPNKSRIARLVAPMLAERPANKRGRTYKANSSHLRALVAEAITTIIDRNC